MALIPQFPVDFTADGDTVSQAINKHINELQNVYEKLDAQITESQSNHQQLLEKTDINLQKADEAQASADEAQQTADTAEYQGERANTRIDALDTKFAPMPTTSYGVGQIINIYTDNMGKTYTLPSDGTWFVMIFQSVVGQGTYLALSPIQINDDTTKTVHGIGIYEGGTKFTTEYSMLAGFAWRIS